MCSRDYYLDGPPFAAWLGYAPRFLNRVDCCSGCAARRWRGPNTEESRRCDLRAWSCCSTLVRCRTRGRLTETRPARDVRDGAALPKTYPARRQSHLHTKHRFGSRTMGPSGPCIKCQAVRRRLAQMLTRATIQMQQRGRERSPLPPTSSHSCIRTQAKSGEMFIRGGPSLGQFKRHCSHAA